MSQRPDYFEFNRRSAGENDSRMPTPSVQDPTPYGSSSRLAFDRNNMATGEKPWSSQAYNPPRAPRRKSKRLVIIALVAFIIVVIFLAVFLPIYFLVIRKQNAPSQSSSSGSTTPPDNGDTGSNGSPGEPRGSTTGGDGSTVTMANGTTFTYTNSFGGFWVHDPEDPFNDGAKPNSWTPALNDTWRWGQDRIYGVNLGGLFVIEPFISPSLFQKYPGATDEWTLSEAMAADQASGGLKQIEDHYDTFITEKDIADIAGAGLNWLRIPIGYWAIDTWPGEPFLPKTSWTYFLRTIEWARKYGLRVVVDLHAVPGSQNGLNHSGRLGTINFLSGNMGIANAERTLYYLRVLTEYFSQPQYKNVVQAIALVNEPLAGDIGAAPLSSFYLKAYDTLRGVTGFGDGNGPYIAVQDGLQGLPLWSNLLPGATAFSWMGIRTSLSAVITQHPWMCRRNIGPTFCGEFSAAPNDCGLFIRAVGVESTHPQCALYNDWENYSDAMKAGLQNFMMASFDSFGDWFFWTWKIGPSQAGRVEAPLWSYKLGLENGWIPSDPRTAVGKCASLNVATSPFEGTFPAYRLGQQPSPTVSAEYSAEFPWPPTSIPNADVPVDLLPTYTNTAPVSTLPIPTFTGAPASATEGLDGWFNNNDLEGAPTPVAGCTYPTGDPPAF
ncbi:hypothetical protein NMY22_g6264 [Coprinellus aureogranulatus]|nr:hypothetical protein NMY22_g6264 [Coprinellus aureogranulatus]